MFFFLQGWFEIFPKMKLNWFLFFIFTLKWIERTQEHIEIKWIEFKVDIGNDSKHIDLREVMKNKKYVKNRNKKGWKIKNVIALETLFQIDISGRRKREKIRLVEKAIVLR